MCLQDSRATLAKSALPLLFRAITLVVSVVLVCSAASESASGWVGGGSVEILAQGVTITARVTAWVHCTFWQTRTCLFPTRQRCLFASLFVSVCDLCMSGYNRWTDGTSNHSWWPSSRGWQEWAHNKNNGRAAKELRWNVSGPRCPE